MSRRIDLNIPHPSQPGWREAKEEVKALGARWDPIAKKWWVSSTRADLHLFARWVPFQPEVVKPEYATHTCPGCGEKIATHVEMCAPCRAVNPVIRRRRRRTDKAERYLAKTSTAIGIDRFGNIVTRNDTAL